MTKSLTALAAATTIGIASVAAPSTADARWGGWWGPAIGGFAVGALIGSAFARPYYGYGYGYGSYYRYGYPAYYSYGYPAYYSYGLLRTATLLPPLLRTAALLPLVNWVRPLFAFLSVWRTVNPRGPPRLHITGTIRRRGREYQPLIPLRQASAKDFNG